MRESNKQNFNPRGNQREQHQHCGSDHQRGPNPDTKAAIWWIMNGGVCRIKLDH
jgi:hypothetical protein